MKNNFDAKAPTVQILVEEQDDLNLDDELLPEYKLSSLKNPVVGKYVNRFKDGTAIVTLEPDVAKAFPTENDVNRALQMLMAVAQEVAAD